MLPLIPIVASLLPSAVKWLAGDDAGQMTEKVINAAQDLFGTDDPEKIEAAIARDPSLALQFKSKLLDIQDAESQRRHIERVKELDDLANARGREIALRDKTPAVLAYGVTIGFFGILAYMIARGVPEGSEALYIMLGALGAAWSNVVGYYYGSSSGSALKTHVMANKK